MDKRIERAETMRTIRDQECIWVRAGEIAHRICIKGFACARCELDQMIIDSRTDPAEEATMLRAAA